MPTPQRIVILGAGFGGTAVAQTLARVVPAEQEHTITLLDRNNFLLFTPMLTEVAGGAVDESDIVAAIRTLSPRITFEQGRVDSIDLHDKRVTLEIGGGSEVPAARRTLQADHLVIALGAVTAFHHIPGVREHALPIKTLSDAAILRNRILTLLERADEEPDQQARRALLTVVVGGGGSSGVETMAALNDLMRQSARHFRHVQPDDIRTLIVEPGDRLLPEVSPRLARYAQRELQRHGIAVILNTRITGAGPDHVQIDPPWQGHPRLDSRTLIWAAGISPSPIVETLDVPHGRHHGVAVDGCCQVPGHPGVWALGDNAEIPRPDGHGTYAATAQNASREGALVARNILAVLQGQSPQPFVYHPVGELSLVGRRSAVATIYGVPISGLPAWLLWRAVYLAKLPRLERRIQVGLKWLLDEWFGRDLVQLPGASQGPARSHSVEEGPSNP